MVSGRTEMQRPSICLALVAMVLLVACSGTGRTPARTPTSRPNTSAASQPAQRPANCPNGDGGTCRGPLEPGTYQTKMFNPPITYTVPAGWTNFEDLFGSFLLFEQRDSQDADMAGGSYLGIYRNVRAAAANCDEAPQPGIGATPQAMVSWFRTVPHLIVSKPKKVSVGGLTGLQVDVSAGRKTDNCHFGGHPAIPLIVGDGTSSSLHHVAVKEIDVRLIILAWQEGNVTLEITNAKEQHSAVEYRAALRPVIDSLKFQI